MTKDQIEQLLFNNPDFRSVPTEIVFNSTNQPMQGFFENFDDTDTLKKENKWRYIPKISALDFQKTKSNQHTVILDGSDIKNISVV